MYDYSRSIEFLENLYRQPLMPAEKVGLERARRLLHEIGNPQDSFGSVHVAGSTGKGSTTTFISEILRAAGFGVGTFRSPHLHSYLERIAVDSRSIDEQQWLRAFHVVLPVVESMQNGSLSNYPFGRPALFEVLFAVACQHFADVGVQWAAMETGLGGRLDATNLLFPDVAVVTNVSLEHTRILGGTTSLIASEKAAIIKSGSHAVTAAEGEAGLVIERRARDVGAPLLRVGQDILWVASQPSLDGQDLTLKANDEELFAHLCVAGGFQAINAATAYGSALALRRRGLTILDSDIAEGLKRTVIPGRLELVSRSPDIILDGAHNPAGLEALTCSLTALLSGRRAVLLFACLSDKDFYDMAARIADIADTVIVTTAPGSPRAARVPELARAFAGQVAAVFEEPDPEQGLNRAIALCDANQTLVVTGSLYLVGYIRQLLKAETMEQ